MINGKMCVLRDAKRRGGKEQCEREREREMRLRSDLLCYTSTVGC